MHTELGYSGTTFARVGDSSATTGVANIDTALGVSGAASIGAAIGTVSTSLGATLGWEAVGGANTDTLATRLANLHTELGYTGTTFVRVGDASATTGVANIDTALGVTDAVSIGAAIGSVTGSSLAAELGFVTANTDDLATRVSEIRSNHIAITVAGASLEAELQTLVESIVDFLDASTFQSGTKPGSTYTVQAILTALESITSGNTITVA